MRILFIATLLLATALAGCADSQPKSLGAPPEMGFLQLVTDWTYQHVTETVDGLTVTMEVYLPDAASALRGQSVPETFPTVVMTSPYNFDGIGADLSFGGYPAYEGLFQRLVQHGYAVVMADSGAMGGASGCWDFMGPQDVAGAVASIKAVTMQPWSNGKVGMHGLSYDGMTQVMAASAGVEGLVTVVPAAALTHAYAGLYHGGVHYGGGWYMTTAGYTQSANEPRENPDRRAGWLEGLTDPTCVAETNAMGNDPTGAYNSYYQERDFRPLAAHVNASVFVIQGFFDNAVKPDNFGTWFNDIQTPKKAWLGWWHHTYPTAEGGGRDDLILTLHRWFDHELKGIDNGILDEPMFDVMDSKGQWRHEDAWPPADASNYTLFLTADALAEEPPEAGAIVIRSLEPIMAGPSFSSQPIGGWHITGTPKLILPGVTGVAGGGQIIAMLYDATENRLISQGAINLQVAEDPTSAQPLTPLDAVDVQLDLYPVDYLLPAGNQLELVLQTQEGSPFGWYAPDAYQSTPTVPLGEARLELAILERDPDDIFLVACGWLLGLWEDCFDRDLEDQGI